MRVLLDTNTQQALVDHGGSVFEHEPYRSTGRSGADAADVEALRGIFMVASRAYWEFAVSDHSPAEAIAARDGRYAQYTRDVGFHWADSAASHPAPFEGSGATRVRPLDEGKCGYLSDKDARLVRDAVLGECDTFLTIERMRTRNAEHLSWVVGI